MSSRTCFLLQVHGEEKPTLTSIISPEATDVAKTSSPNATSRLTTEATGTEEENPVIDEPINDRSPGVKNDKPSKGKERVTQDPR